MKHLKYVITGSLVLGIGLGVVLAAGYGVSWISANTISDEARLMIERIFSICLGAIAVVMIAIEGYAIGKRVWKEK